MVLFRRNTEIQPATTAEERSKELPSADALDLREVLRPPSLEQAQGILLELSAKGNIYIDKTDLFKPAHEQGRDVLIFYAIEQSIASVIKYVKEKGFSADIRQIPSSEERQARPGESWYGWYLEVSQIAKAAAEASKQSESKVSSPIEQPEDSLRASATENPTQSQSSAHTSSNGFLTLESIGSVVSRVEKVPQSKFTGNEAAELEELINTARRQNKST